MKTITENAVLINTDGYRQEEGLTITDMGDIIAIGGTPHNRSDLVVTENRIESVLGWCVMWD